ncbi:hypothetical protein ABS767_14785 [Sphingomonas sp. ST-64]|uniref:DUF4398 domain-containing protein n=1 Tax=Sphingomonas plantiphila TaxID=3163295 RepID=A0ABW8YSU7_9SPHN
MRTPVLLSIPLALCACSTRGDGYPSLLPRPIEGRSDAEPARPEPVATPDAALDSRIAAQRAEAETVATRFRSLALETESRIAVARGVAVGDERWISAQTALADLDRTRGELVQIVTDLELTASSRIQAGAPAYPALDAAIATLATQATEQAQRIAALERALND